MHCNMFEKSRIQAIGSEAYELNASIIVEICPQQCKHNRLHCYGICGFQLIESKLIINRNMHSIEWKNNHQRPNNNVNYVVITYILFIREQQKFIARGRFTVRFDWNFRTRNRKQQMLLNFCCCSFNRSKSANATANSIQISQSFFDCRVRAR